MLGMKILGGRPFDQLYIYEENIILDKVKIRNDKLKELGL